MFPISDSHKSNKFPIVTLLLIAVNVAVFFLELNAPDTEAFINQYALVPSSVNFLNPATLTAFVTSLFLHGGFFHILSNMWFLWIFGDNVEAKLGRIKYLALYLIAGVAGGLLQYMFTPDSNIPMLGASGAVSGVLAAYLINFPSSKIKTFLVLFLFVSITEIPAVIYIFYWFLIQLLSGIASLPMTFAETGGVAFWAHVGGFVAGLVLARRFKRSEKDPNIIEGELVE